MKLKEKELLDNAFEIGALYMIKRAKNLYVIGTDEVKCCMFKNEYIVLLSNIKNTERNLFYKMGCVLVLTRFGIGEFILDRDLFFSNPFITKVSSSGCSSAG